MSKSDQNPVIMTGNKFNWETENQLNLLLRIRTTVEEKNFYISAKNLRTFESNLRKLQGNLLEKKFNFRLISNIFYRNKFWFSNENFSRIFPRENFCF